MDMKKETEKQSVVAYIICQGLACRFLNNSSLERKMKYIGTNERERCSEQEGDFQYYYSDDRRCSAVHSFDFSTIDDSTQFHVNIEEYPLPVACGRLRVSHSFRRYRVIID